VNVASFFPGGAPCQRRHSANSEKTCVPYDLHTGVAIALMSNEGRATQCLLTFLTRHHRHCPLLYRFVTYTIQCSARHALDIDYDLHIVNVLSESRALPHSLLMVVCADAAIVPLLSQSRP
jgi:hypothetical protein